MRDGGEDDVFLAQGEGNKVKLSGRSGGANAMVEQLIGSVHRLSVASLASMAAADRRDQVTRLCEHY